MLVVIQMVRLEPRLKHQHIPEVGMSIVFAGTVFPPHAANRFWVEISLRAKCLFIQQMFRPFLQFCPEPMGDRNRKSSFWALNQSSWDVTIQQSTQNPFPLSFSHERTVRKGPGELHNLVI